MGRVSKHRRLKSHDPFYRGPRRDRRKGEFDLCPENEDDQPVPKSLIRLMKRAEDIKKTEEETKKRKKKAIAEEPGGGADTPVEDGDLRPKRKEKRREEKGEPAFTRRKGESLRNYLERIDIETNAKIMETFRKNRKPSERRMKRLQERQRKAVARRKGLNIEEEEIEQDRVKFGEVVQAPPQLKAKPRGSKTATPAAAAAAASSKPLLLQQKMAGTPSQPVAQKSSNSSPPPPRLGLKRQRDLEIERERVIAAYRKSKTFHYRMLAQLQK